MAASGLRIQSSPKVAPSVFCWGSHFGTRSIHCDFHNHRNILRFCVALRDAKQGFSQPRSDKKKNNQTERTKGDESSRKTRDASMSKSDFDKSGARTELLFPSSKQESSLIPSDEEEFEERLRAIKRSAEVKIETKEQQKFAPIDYDRPPATNNDWMKNIYLKIGAAIGAVGVIVAFGFGDFLPSGSGSIRNVQTTLTTEETLKFKARLEDFEAVLATSPGDPAALKGAGVTYSQLQDYGNAASRLENLIKIRPDDVEALQLLAEARRNLGDYAGSIRTYQDALKVSSGQSLPVLQGLTDVLLDAKRPDQAVAELIVARERLKSNTANTLPSDGQETAFKQVDPVQIELLLGKSYMAWGHPGDAVTVYDTLISSYPDDFRGYLAKGLLLKQQEKRSEAERMFIQARFLAPPKMKPLVDSFSNS